MLKTQELHRIVSPFHFHAPSRSKSPPLHLPTLSINHICLYAALLPAQTIICCIAAHHFSLSCHFICLIATVVPKPEVRSHKPSFFSWDPSGSRSRCPHRHLLHCSHWDYRYSSRGLQMGSWGAHVAGCLHQAQVPRGHPG